MKPTTMMTNKTTIPARAFQIRAYGMQELAILYNPLVTPPTALKRFKHWIYFHPSLVGELENLGWQKGTRLLTPLMVEAIVRRLGEP